MVTSCRGVRGATSADANTPEAILAATRELLETLIEANGIAPTDVGSIFLTATPDLNADFPAQAARQMGWADAALLCAQEIAVPEATPRVIRVLIHWNTPKSAAEIRHVYLKEARALRPDRALA
ncbi:chorismate mutase [bacterium]|nr:chorismate mutase [bacterium]